MLTPMTELDAVNEMLSMVGEAPVNDVATTQLSEALLAKRVLENVSRATQAEGLNCNTVTNYQLNLDGNNKLPVPSNALSVDPVDRTLDLIVHKGFLYKKDGLTNKFDKDIKCKVVFLMDFVDLPEHVRQYIAIRAARVFQKRVVGSADLHSLTQEEEVHARANMRSREVENEDHNMLTGFLAAQGSINRGSVW